MTESEGNRNDRRARLSHVKPASTGLWRAFRQVLADAISYTRTSRAAYYRSRDYWPALVANQLLKVVS